MIRPAIAPIFWAKGVAAVVALAATLPAMKVLSGSLRRWLEQPPEWTPEELIGKVGVTDVSEVRRDFGRALVEDGQHYHVVEVRSRGEIIGPRGVTVILKEFEATGYFFWVERVDETDEYEQADAAESVGG